MAQDTNPRISENVERMITSEDDELERLGWLVIIKSLQSRTEWKKIRAYLFGKYTYNAMQKKKIKRFYQANKNKYIKHVDARSQKEDSSNVAVK